MSQTGPDAFIPRQIRDVDELKIEILYLAGDAEAVSPMGAELLRAVARAVEPDTDSSSTMVRNRGAAKLMLAATSVASRKN